MQTIGSDDLNLVLTAIHNEIATLQGMDGEDAARNETIEALQDFEAFLESGEWVIVDTKPQCCAPDEKGERCENEGYLVPTLYVRDSKGAIVAQLETQPPIVLCADHAINNVGEFFSREVWRDIQAQVSQRYKGMLVSYDDARLYYRNIKSGQMEPPAKLALVKP